MAVIAEFKPKEPAPLAPSATGDLVSDNGDIRVSFTATSEGNAVEFRSGDYYVRHVPREIKYIDRSTGLEDILCDADSTVAAFAVRDYQVFYDRHFAGVTESWKVEGGQLKHNVTLNLDQRQPADWISEPWLAVAGTLEYHPDLQVRVNGLNLIGSFDTGGEVELVDPSGRAVFTLPPIKTWDQNKEETGGLYIASAMNPGRLDFATAVDNAWLTDQNREYPIVIDPTVVVASAYDTSGNGGRKLVRLSNGRLVAVARNTSTNTLYFYKSADEGATWTQLCTANVAGTGASYAVASSGTTVYYVNINTNGAVYLGKFNATTQTNTQISESVIEQGLNAVNSASMCIDGAGALHVAYSCKTPTYPNSLNIRYSKSTDGGATWAAATQITTYNLANKNVTNPCIVLRSNNYPSIVWQFLDSASTPSQCAIGVTNWNGSAWVTAAAWIYTTQTYGQNSPCAVVDGNDAIHLIWHGADSTNTTYNLRYSKSNDGGQTWSSMTKVTNASSNNQTNPSMTINPSNNDLYVYFEGVSAAGYTQVRSIAFIGGSWGSITDLTTGATTHAKSPQTLWSKFNMNSSDAIRVIYMDDSTVKYDSITLNTPPTAPTLTQEPNFDATSAQTLAWTFNDTAGDTQSAYQLQIYDAAAATTVVDTGKVASPTSSYALAAGALVNGKQYQWRVQTWDSVGAQGTYSAYNTFYTAAAPTVTITLPAADGAIVATSNLTAQWSYSDPASNAQQTYQVQLTDSTGNTVLWDSGQTPSATANALTIGYVLQNNTAYKLKVTAINSKGITGATAVRAFSTSFTPPTVPVLASTVYKGYIGLLVTNPAPSGSQPVVVGNDVYRREKGTTAWTRIATNIPMNGAYSDYQVKSAVVYEYKVTAIGANSTSSDSLVVSPAAVTLIGLWLNAISNPSATVMNILYQQNAKKDQWTPSSTPMQFAGRTRKVVEFGEMDNYTISGQKLTFLSAVDWNAFLSLVQQKKTLCLRDGRGRKVFVVVTDVQNQDDSYGFVADVTFEEVDYTEAV